MRASLHTPIIPTQPWVRSRSSSPSPSPASRQCLDSLDHAHLFNVSPHAELVDVVLHFFHLGIHRSLQKARGMARRRDSDVSKCQPGARWRSLECEGASCARIRRGTREAELKGWSQAEVVWCGDCTVKMDKRVDAVSCGEWLIRRSELNGGSGAEWWWVVWWCGGVVGGWWRVSLSARSLPSEPRPHHAMPLRADREVKRCKVHSLSVAL